jgi:DNA invertase Pin-like site-specific DNA recombinase
MFMDEHVIAYTRVSTEEQADSRAGLEAQRAAILLEAQRRGWTEADIHWVEDAGYSGKDLKRPGIKAALEALRRRKADTLVVSKLDRVSRSLLDFAGLMDRATRERWALVALDLGVDTSSPAGEAMAHVTASFAQFERRLIGQRTKDALKIKKAQGVQLGRPVVTSPEIASRIARLRQEGHSFKAIADHLNAAGVATSHGGSKWWPSSVRAVLRTAACG